MRKCSFYQQAVCIINVLPLQHIVPVFFFLPWASEHCSVALECNKFLIFASALHVCSLKYFHREEGLNDFFFLVLLCCREKNKTVLWLSGLTISCKQNASQWNCCVVLCKHGLRSAEDKMWQGDESPFLVCLKTWVGVQRRRNMRLLLTVEVNW